MESEAEALLYRFRLQIRYAAEFIHKKYTFTIELDDARQQAALLTLEYNESGVLAGIERKVGGDANQIDRYFLRELKCDLLNWAKKIHRIKQREVLVASDEIRTQLQAEVNPYDEVDLRLSWPLWCMRVFDRMGNREIAKELGVSVRTVSRMLAEERVKAMEFYVNG